MASSVSAHTRAKRRSNSSLPASRVKEVSASVLPKLLSKVLFKVSFKVSFSFARRPFVLAADRNRISSSVADISACSDLADNNNNCHAGDKPEGVYEMFMAARRFYD